MVPTATPSETERLLPHRPPPARTAGRGQGRLEPPLRRHRRRPAALPRTRTAKIAEEGAATGQPDYTRLTAAILEQTDQLRRDPARHNEVWRSKWPPPSCSPNPRWKTSSRWMRISPAHRCRRQPPRRPRARRGTRPAGPAASRRNVAPGPGAPAARIGGARDPHQPRRHRTDAGRLLPRHLAPGHPGRRSSSRSSRSRARCWCSGQDRANDALAECAQAIEHFATPGFTPQANDFETSRKSSRRWAFSSPSCKAARPTSTPYSSRRPPAQTRPRGGRSRRANTRPDARDRGTGIIRNRKRQRCRAFGSGRRAEPEIAAMAEDVGRRSPAGLRSGRFRSTSGAPCRSRRPARRGTGPVGRRRRDWSMPARKTSTPNCSRIFLEEANEVLATINQHLPLVASRPGRPRLAGHGTPQLPYPERQRPHGRPVGTRRSRLGRGAGAQRLAARTRIRRPPPCSKCSTWRPEYSKAGWPSSKGRQQPPGRRRIDPAATSWAEPRMPRHRRAIGTDRCAEPPVEEPPEGGARRSSVEAVRGRSSSRSPAVGRGRPSLRRHRSHRRRGSGADALQPLPRRNARPHRHAASPARA
jgi:hypothetical protein